MRSNKSHVPHTHNPQKLNREITNTRQPALLYCAGANNARTCKTRELELPRRGGRFSASAWTYSRNDTATHRPPSIAHRPQHCCARTRSQNLYVPGHGWHHHHHPRHNISQPTTYLLLMVGRRPALSRTRTALPLKNAHSAPPKRNTNSQQSTRSLTKTVMKKLYNNSSSTIVRPPARRFGVSEQMDTRHSPRQPATPEKLKLVALLLCIQHKCNAGDAAASLDTC